MFPGLSHSEGRPHTFLRDRERAATCWVLILINISHLTFPSLTSSLRIVPSHAVWHQMLPSGHRPTGCEWGKRVERTAGINADQEHESRLVAKLAEAGCATCVFNMPGVAVTPPKNPLTAPIAAQSNSSRIGPAEDLEQDDGGPSRSPVDVWGEPRRGANYETFNPNAAGDFAAAKSYGMDILRVFTPGLPKEWPADQDYFSSDAFEEQLRIVDSVLEIARKEQLGVILVGGSVPYRQYEWYTHGRGDRRLWKRRWRHEDFARFWGQLAQRYGKRTALVALEPLNEPHPEVLEDREDWTDADLAAFARKVRGTPADVNVLFRQTIKAIRAVDQDVAIILNSGFWASPRALSQLEPIRNDDNVLYSVHWYEPSAFTIWRQNKGRIHYPGCKLANDCTGEGETWNLETHRRLLGGTVRAWQKKHGIPSRQILLGEFSADRRDPMLFLPRANRASE